MAAKTPDDFSRLRMTVACAMDAEAQTLLRHLQRTRAVVRHVWPLPEKIGNDADIVLIDCAPGVAQHLDWMPGEAAAALVLLLPQTGRIDLRDIQAACPDAVLHRPYLPQAIDVALAVARDHFGYSKRQRIRISRMEENIRAIRDIEKAKRVIMDRNQVNEEEAFRIMRQMAMERRATIASIAAKLVDSAALLV